MLKTWPVILITTNRKTKTKFKTMCTILTVEPLQRIVLVGVVIRNVIDMALSVSHAGLRWLIHLHGCKLLTEPRFWKSFTEPPLHPETHRKQLITHLSHCFSKYAQIFDYLNKNLWNDSISKAKARMQFSLAFHSNKSRSVLLITGDGWLIVLVTF